MNTYYLRASGRAELVGIGVDLDLLVDDEDGTRAASSEIIWDEVGTIHEPTGDADAEGCPIFAPVTDAEGNLYWHANIYMPHVLIEWAQVKHAEAVQAGDSALADRIAQHIASSPAYFPLDAQGQPRKPNNPVRILWI